MPNGINLSDRFLKADRQWEVLGDFRGGTTGWTAAATSGTVGVGTGGQLSLTTQAANNAEGTVTLGTKPALPAAGKPISFAARIQMTDSTGAAQAYVGLSSAAIADALQDSSAGPPANSSGFGFFKTASTNWTVEASNGTTQVTAELTAVNSLDKLAKLPGSASYQLLEIDFMPKNATQCDVIFKINGITVYKITDFVFTSMAAMAPLAMIKAGAAGAAEVSLYDFIKAAGVR